MCDTIVTLGSHTVNGFTLFGKTVTVNLKKLMITLNRQEKLFLNGEKNWKGLPRIEPTGFTVIIGISITRETVSFKF